MDFRFQLDPSLPYERQIEEKIKGMIEAGTLRANTPLPTVRELAARLGVNFNTVARAYRVLDSAGYLSTRQGRGTFVRERAREEEKEAKTAVQLVEQSLIQLIEQLEGSGLTREQIDDGICQLVSVRKEELINTDKEKQSEQVFQPYNRLQPFQKENQPGKGRRREHLARKKKKTLYYSFMRANSWRSE